MTFFAPDRGAALPQALVVPQPQHDPLVHVIGLTEKCFFEAGDSLSRAVDQLHGTQALFARLEDTLGDETGRHLAQLISRTTGNIESIRADFDGFLGQNADLRMAVRGVRVEVGELDRVVRTISSVSVNARILGNALMPPRPQVIAFIEWLARMSQEAETILRDVKDAMAGIGQDSDMMDQTLQDMRQDLMQQVFPALARFAVVAQKVQAGRAEMTEFSAGLSDRMKAVFAEVSRLIVALQSGDSTRQRLQRVQDVLAAVSGEGAQAIAPRKGLDAVLHGLAAVLAEAARADAEGEVDVSIAALAVLQRDAEQAMQSARQFYFARTGHNRDGASNGAPDKLDESLDRVRHHLEAMRARAQGLAGRLDVITKHEATIRQIAQQVRLSGLNAVLICAKLGEEGRALRELAQWLRALTDESDTIVIRLQGRLAETRDRTEAAGQAGVDRLEQALMSFISDAQALNCAMARIDSTVTETSRGFDAAGRSLPVQISQAEASLTEFRTALGEIDGLCTMLRLQHAMLAAAPHPFVQGSPEAEILAGLRARYTMQQERSLHDAYLAAAGHGLPDSGASPVTSSPSAASGDEALDDIFF